MMLFQVVSLLYMCTHFANGQVGICTQKIMETKIRYVADRRAGVWRTETYNVPKEVTGCCDGYDSSNPGGSPLQCTPVCEPECTNATCDLPNTCVCLPGHVESNNSSSTCIDICDSCVNAQCVERREGDAECVCQDGYQRDSKYVHICNPICSPPCVNATCSAPGKCECLEGFKEDLGSLNTCVPYCQESCVFGRCTAPDECTCFDGYINDESSPSICMPKCTPECKNGFCSAPSTCRCSVGFRPHAEDPSQCVTDSPENASMKFCELKIPKAIKFDKNEQCFIVRDKLSVQGDPKCQPMSVLSQPICSQPNSCFNKAECLMNFRCSTKEVNKSKEMHCQFSTGNFSTEEIPDSFVSSNEWSDLVLMISSFQNVSLAPAKNDLSQVHEWTVSPLYTGPICGENHFVLQICNSDDVMLASKLESSKLPWIISPLVAVFVLLLVAGGGAFLWLRHRRLNDPLNYRENMLSGFSNEGYVDETRQTAFLNLDEVENADL